MSHFKLYDFLWQDDMLGNYYDFIKHEPGIIIIKKEVDRLMKIEKKVRINFLVIYFSLNIAFQ